MHKLIVMALLALALAACKKSRSSTINECSSNDATTRQIVNKKATVKVTATIVGVYLLVEEGATSTQLVPCSIEQQYVQNNLRVTISGNVKATKQTAQGPCCYENIVLTAISR